MNAIFWICCNMRCAWCVSWIIRMETAQKTKKKRFSFRLCLSVTINTRVLSSSRAIFRKQPCQCCMATKVPTTNTQMWDATHHAHIIGKCDEDGVPYMHSALHWVCIAGTTLIHNTHTETGVCVHCAVNAAAAAATISIMRAGDEPART